MHIWGKRGREGGREGEREGGREGGRERELVFLSLGIPDPDILYIELKRFRPQKRNLNTRVHKITIQCLIHLCHVGPLSSSIYTDCSSYKCVSTLHYAYVCVPVLDLHAPGYIKERKLVNKIPLFEYSLVHTSNNTYYHRPQ